MIAIIDYGAGILRSSGAPWKTTVRKRSDQRPESSVRRCSGAARVGHAGHAIGESSGAV